MALLGPCPGSVGPGKRPRWGFTRSPGSGSPSDARWDSRKSLTTRSPAAAASGSSSDERWDARKRARMEKEEEEKKEVVVEEKEKVYAGPAFTVAPPDPSELPMPWLLILPRYID